MTGSVTNYSSGLRKRDVETRDMESGSGTVNSGSADAKACTVSAKCD